MNASFVLNSGELNYMFIDKLKEMFQGKRIELTISEADDTNYLMTSQANKKIILESISNIKNNKNIHTADSKLFE